MRVTRTPEILTSYQLSSRNWPWALSPIAHAAAPAGEGRGGAGRGLGLAQLCQGCERGARTPRRARRARAGSGPPRADNGTHRRWRRSRRRRGSQRLRPAAARGGGLGNVPRHPLGRRARTFTAFWLRGRGGRGGTARRLSNAEPFLCPSHVKCHTVRGRGCWGCGSCSWRAVESAFSASGSLGVRTETSLPSPRSPPSIQIPVHGHHRTVPHTPTARTGLSSPRLQTPH